MTKTIFLIAQIVISVGLVVTVLLQKRGANLGGAFGGSGGSYYQKRGVEKLLFYATIVFAFLFLAAAFTILLIS